LLTLRNYISDSRVMRAFLTLHTEGVIFFLRLI
jgi:hypothetical protein